MSRPTSQPTHVAMASDLSCTHQEQSDSHPLLSKQHLSAIIFASQWKIIRYNPEMPPQQGLEHQLFICLWPMAPSGCRCSRNTSQEPSSAILGKQVPWQPQKSMEFPCGRSPFYLPQLNSSLSLSLFLSIITFSKNVSITERNFIEDQVIWFYVLWSPKQHHGR